MHCHRNPVLRRDNNSLARMLVELRTAIRLENTCNLSRGGVYRLLDPKTGETMYVGRTLNLQQRRNDHRSNPKFESLRFVEVAQTDVYAEQRGIEQRAMDRYGARSISGRPEYNKIEGVSPQNPLRDIYSSAVEAFPSLELF